MARGLSAGRYRRRLGRSAAAAALTAPLAAVGAAVHVLPYQVMKQVGRRPTNEGMRATVKLLGCLVLFTSLYTALGVAVGRRRGPAAGLAAFVLGPTSGYVTVRWVERVQRLGGFARARGVMAQRHDLLADLEAQRAEVTSRAMEIVGSGAAGRRPVGAAR